MRVRVQGVGKRGRGVRFVVLVKSYSRNFYNQKNEAAAAQRRTWSLILVLVIGGDHTVRHHIHAVARVGVVYRLHHVGGGCKHRREIASGGHLFILSLDGGNRPEEGGCCEAYKAHLADYGGMDRETHERIALRII